MGDDGMVTNSSGGANVTGGLPRRCFRVQWEAGRGHLFGWNRRDGNWCDGKGCDGRIDNPAAATVVAIAAAKAPVRTSGVRPSWRVAGGIPAMAMQERIAGIRAGRQNSRSQ